MIRRSEGTHGRVARRAGACVGIGACAAALAAALTLPLAGCSAGAGAGSAAAGSAAAGATSSQGSSEAPTTTVVPDFRDTDLGCGWQPTGSLELRYARRFSVDYYEGGYQLVCIADGSRYLVVPEGASAPQGLADDIVCIQQPVGDVYLAASDSMCLFDALGETGRVTVSGIRQEDWSIEAAREAMASGAIAYGGKYSAPDYDLLLSKGVRLAVESTMINHTPDVREKLQELGIPVLVEMASYEDEPLGRTEWIKLWGALLGQEERADEVFDEQARKAEAARSEDTGKTVAFFYINSNGAAVVRKPGDYVTKMIQYAGGDYVFQGLGDDSSARSTVTLEMERFYEEARDADYVVYNASIDGGVSSVDELVQKNRLLADFKAVREGNVWCTTQDMYQQMTNTGSIISDFHEMLADPDATDLEYLHRLG
jgi:iron complex transport system substrate-binding protein